MTDAPAWILPDLDDEVSAPFWAGTARGELLVQTCAQCGLTRMPPRPMCPSCRSLDHTWEPSSGRGTVWSFAVPHPPLLPAYAEVAPYNVLIVALDEDPTIRFVGNLVAREGGPINEVDPATIEIGEPVRVTYAQVDDVTLPRWMRR
ncbi:MAG TPA: OB-fold domain-containing protein [Acidimicrobiia bacterium]|jgi:hypothetical protein